MVSGVRCLSDPFVGCDSHYPEGLVISVLNTYNLLTIQGVCRRPAAARICNSVNNLPKENTNGNNGKGYR
jgi:hypothetical protein